MAFRHDRLHRVAFHVGFQRLPRGKYLCADNTTLGLIVVQSLDVDLKSVAGSEFFAALWTEVTLVQVVFLNVVRQVGLVCAEIVAHCATPAPAHAVLRSHLHRHALDHMEQI